MSDTASVMLVEIVVKGGEASVRTIKATADASSKAGTASKKAGKEHEAHAKGLNKVTSASSGLFSSLKSTLGIGSVLTLGYAVKSVVGAGMEWQKQMTAINQSLKVQGQLSKSASKEVEDAINKSATHGGFGKEEQATAFQQFMSETHSKQQALTDLTSATSLARGTGLDFARAQKMIGMAQSGSTGRLQRYIGPLIAATDHLKALTKANKNATVAEVEKAKILDKQETATKALALIQQKFGGQTQAYGNTAAGAWSNFSNTLKAAEEQLGTKLLPILTEVLKAGTAILIEMVKGEGVWKKVAAVLKTVWTVLKTVWEFFEHNNKALKVLLIALGFLAAAWAVQKVIDFYKALKSLWLIEKLGALMKWMVPKILGMGAAEGVAAGETGFLAGAFATLRGAAVSVLIPFAQVLAALLAIVAVAEVASRLMGKGSFIENVSEMLSGHESAYWAEKEQHTVERGAKGEEHALHTLAAARKAHPHVIQRSLAVGKPAHHSTGGIVGGQGSLDNQVALLTPGEYIMRKQAVQSIGVERLNSMNGQGASAGASAEYLPVHNILKLDGRVLAESVTRYALRRKAA